MKRSAVGLLCLCVGLLLLVAPPAIAQPAGKVARVGVLSAGPWPPDPQRTPLWLSMRDFGWIEGQNLVVDRRFSAGNYERLPQFAAELVGLKPDVIVAVGDVSATVAKQASATIPIVFAFVGDPVTLGLVPSLARPGGNITGLTDRASPELGSRRLQMLKEIVPGASKLAMLTRPLGPADAGIRPWVTAGLDAYQKAARALGTQAVLWHAQTPQDIAAAFAAMAQQGIGGVDVADWSLFQVHRREIIDLAARHRLPAMYGHRTWALEGGLMAYGVDNRDVIRRLAAHVDKVLKGARPADLPVEQPTKFELVLNEKTAKALGLAFPQSLLVQADEVIP